MYRLIILSALIIIISSGCSGKSDLPVTLAQTTPPFLQIGRQIPDLELEAYQTGNMKKIRLSQYRGKWLILFFYPADFTFVCPTELKDMSDHYAKFRKAGAEVVSVSTDSVFVHRAWADQHEDIKKIQYPMASDRPGKLSRMMGTYDDNKGISIRASFIINPEGRIVAVEMTDEAIGRSAAELLRKLEAAVAVRDSDGGFCPANWHTGDEMITPK